MKPTTKDQRREKALEKIRKMYALANDAGASEGEIENALKFAQSLMAKFNIEEGEVDLSPDDIDIEVQDNDRLQCERKYWSWDLLLVIGRANDCDVLKSKRLDKNLNWVDYYKIIGTKADRLLTRELFNLTVPLIRSLYAKRYLERKRYLKENPMEAFLDPLPVRHFFVASYIVGFIKGLDLKLKQNKIVIEAEDKTGKYGLMVITKDALIKDFIDGNIKLGKPANSTSSNQLDATAYELGEEDGKDNYNKKLM